MMRKTGFRIQDSRFRLMLIGAVLLLAADIWHPAPTLAQMPAGTPVNNVNAKWVTDHGSQVYNVKAFGAMGDGTTDDTAAIQAGLNDVCGIPGTSTFGSGWLYFPPGTYRITSSIYGWSSNGHGCHVSGAGNSGSQSSVTSILWAGPAGGAMLVWMGGAGPLVEGMNFNANGSAKFGIVVTGTNQVPQTTLNPAGGAVSPGAQTVTPGSMTSIRPPSGQYPGTILNVDTGVNYEVVFVTATTSSTFTATFTKSHAATAVIGGSGGLWGMTFRSVGVFDVAGTYSAGWFVGQPVGADLSQTLLENCWYTGANSGGAYAGLLIDSGWSNVLDLTIRGGGYGPAQYGIDASSAAGYLSIEGNQTGGNTVADFYLGTTLTRIADVRAEPINGERFIAAEVGGTAMGFLELIDTDVEGGTPSDDVVVQCPGSCRLSGNSFRNLRIPGTTIPKIAMRMGSPWTLGDLTLNGNTFVGVTSGYPPIVDYSGNAVLPSYIDNRPVPVHCLNNYGWDQGGSILSKLSDYSAVGVLADESQTPTAQTGVLRGGNTSCLLGWRNHAGSGDVTVCKDTSDVLHLGGPAGIGVGAGPTWTYGAAAPTGSCSPNGSIYSNTAGTAGSTTYSCVAGAWVDIN